MPGYNGDQMAAELNMQSKHSLEESAALAADAFTTVSDVTARECEQLLGRRPLVTPNAFEQNFVPKGAKFNKARVDARAKLLQVARSLTGEDYTDDNLIVGTSGRCEFRNKGLDVTIDALNMTRDKLNQLSNLHRKIVMFIMVPAWTEAPRKDLQNAMSQNKVVKLFDPVITHNIHNFDTDPIYNKINFLGLRNEIYDSVKVIYVPSYLNGNDGIFNMSYYQLLVGFDLTIFPSYYEPWGYTPLESAAFGVPTITTDLAGFGQWVLNTQGDNFVKSGVKVIHRTDSNYSETVAAVSDGISNVFMMQPAELRKAKNAAKRTSKLASWDNFIGYYDIAYDQALKIVQQRMVNDADGL